MTPVTSNQQQQKQTLPLLIPQLCTVGSLEKNKKIFVLGNQPIFIIIIFF